MTNTARQQSESTDRRACILHAEDDRFTLMSIARLPALDAIEELLGETGGGKGGVRGLEN